MWVLIINLGVALLIPILMLLLRLLVIKSIFSTDLFECGFDSFNVGVFPVSLRFFIFCVVFLILDLELVVVFICPLLMSLGLLLVNFFIFVLLVTLGLAVEWVYGCLRWVE